MKKSNTMIKIYDTEYHRSYLVPVDEVDIKSSFGTFVQFKALKEDRDPVELKSVDGKNTRYDWSMEVGIGFWDGIYTKKDLISKYGVK